mgnify:FL=1
MSKNLSILLEQEAPTKAGPSTTNNPINFKKSKLKDKPANDSVDDQIDALILRYETSSIKSEPSLNESLKSLNLRFLLEQEDDMAPPDDEAEDDAVEDEVEEEDAEEAAEPSGSENISVTEPADKQEVPDLDIDRFANRVVRLINNYQSLLNVEEAILNRAKTFLDENYGDAFVQSFSDTLVQTYGIEVVEFNDVPEVEEDNFAIGAFAGGTGGLGGGGA